ncbi:MAG: ABC transporter permease [Lachnospiraceae bacterium]|nr:ABC transporter permease [Lachnospiraceae bacterium]
MRTTLQLVKRNSLMYLRDKSSVFFSMLSMLIVLGLMVVFLGNMNRDNVVNLLSEYGEDRNTDIDMENAEHLIEMWTVAGILVVNAVMVTLTVIGTRIQDEEKKRLQSFYVAPVKPVKIALGYIFSALFIGTIMCILTLAVAEAYIFFKGGSILNLKETLTVIGLILLNVFLYSCILFFVGMFVKSDSAWSGFGTVIGTLVGFVGGIYLPVGFLPEKVQNVLKALPVLHGNAMMRDIFTKRALEETFAGIPKEVVTEYKNYMGITVEVGGEVVSLEIQVAFLLGFAIIMIIGSIIAWKKFDRK